MITSIGRRQFLRGIGGASLALPLLPSLWPREAFAGVDPDAPDPRFVAMYTGHGGVWGRHMYPDDTSATEQHALYSGHAIHYAPLSPQKSGGVSTLSPVVSADESRLSDAIVAKMMLLRGLDIAMYLAHHAGGVLGNYAEGAAGEEGLVTATPTIDQIMAYSPSFYPDLATIKKRSIHIGLNDHGTLSWGYANPSDPQSGVQQTPTETSSLALFNEIFVPPPDDDEPQRPLMVDRVLESYQRLRDGAFGFASRLSAADRARLGDHMERIFELQRKLNAQANCGELTPPSEEAEDYPSDGYTQDLEGIARRYQLYNDVVVAAFICGTCRIALYKSMEMWSTAVPGSDWHESIAHQCNVADGLAQQVMLESQKLFFQEMFLDLANKMEAVTEINGRTMLDNSLIFWTQESGPLTHDNQSTPVVTAGSAGGFFTTGQYVDYRNRNNTVLVEDYYENEQQEIRPGLLYNQWLATMLQAMRVPPSEFEQNGEPGYGPTYRSNTSAWSNAVLSDASEVLPLIGSS
jgi:hypothetical protein